MTFKLSDLMPGDIVRLDNNRVGKVTNVTGRYVCIAFGLVIGNFPPSRIKEIEQVTVGERTIGV